MKRKSSLNLKIAGVTNIIVGLVFFLINSFVLLLSMVMGLHSQLKANIFIFYLIFYAIFTVSCGLLILVGILIWSGKTLGVKIGRIVSVSIIFSWVMMHLFGFFHYIHYSRLSNFKYYLQGFLNFQSVLIFHLPLIYAIYFIIYLTRTSTIEQFT